MFVQELFLKHLSMRKKLDTIYFRWMIIEEDYYSIFGCYFGIYIQFFAWAHSKDCRDYNIVFHGARKIERTYE